MPVNRSPSTRDPDHTPRTKAEQSARTRRVLIDAARELFARDGYTDTARERICERAGVTRGALDHHFDGKKGLLHAVVLDVEERLGLRIAEAAMAAGTDPFDMLRTGCRAYVDAAIEPEVGRILFLDGRAVLGSEAWEKIQTGHGLGMTVEAVRGLFEHRGVARDPEPVARMLLAALTEAAMYVATADDPGRARAQAVDEIDRLLDGWFRD